MEVRSSAFPIFVLVPDEGGTIRRNANQRELNWFEQIDIEEMDHHGWDFESRPIRLIWNSKSEQVDAVVTGPRDLNGFEQAALRYLAMRPANRRGWGHLSDPLLLEADLKSMKQL